MAVVTKYGNGYRDPASLLAVDSVFSEGDPQVISSKHDIANGDSANSLLYVGQVPSNAIIDPSSSYYYGAITGVNDIDLGFANDPDALVDGDDVSSAGSQTLAGHGTHTIARMPLRAWQLAGLSADPGGNLDVFWTLKAAATAAASLYTVLRYMKQA